jgi:hypothetical protein
MAAKAAGLAMFLLSAASATASPESPELAVLEPSGVLLPPPEAAAGTDGECRGVLFCVASAGAAEVAEAPPAPEASATPIPLPAALTLLGAGMAVLAMLLRSRARLRG